MVLVVAVPASLTVQISLALKLFVKALFRTLARIERIEILPAAVAAVAFVKGVAIFGRATSAV